MEARALAQLDPALDECGEAACGALGDPLVAARSDLELAYRGRIDEQLQSPLAVGIAGRALAVHERRVARACERGDRFGSKLETGEPHERGRDLRRSARGVDELEFERRQALELEFDPLDVLAGLGLREETVLDLIRARPDDDPVSARRSAQLELAGGVGQGLAREQPEIRILRAARDLGPVFRPLGMAARPAPLGAQADERARDRAIDSIDDATAEGSGAIEHDVRGNDVLARRRRGTAPGPDTVAHRGQRHVVPALRPHLPVDDPHAARPAGDVLEAKAPVRGAARVGLGRFGAARLEVEVHRRARDRRAEIIDDAARDRAPWSDEELELLRRARGEPHSTRGLCVGRLALGAHEDRVRLEIAQLGTALLVGLALREIMIAAALAEDEERELRDRRARLLVEHADAQGAGPACQAGRFRSRARLGLLGAALLERL